MAGDKKNIPNQSDKLEAGESAPADASASDQGKKKFKMPVIRRSSLDQLLELPATHNWITSAVDGDDDEGGEGLPDLNPDDAMEYEQRLARRKGEAKYGSHVREARDPSDVPDQDMGMGAGIKGHPLLADMPLGSQAAIEQINAAENDAAKIELKRKLENKKRAEHTSIPTPRAY